MEKYRYTHVAVLILAVSIFYSCRLTNRLEEAAYRPLVNQPGRKVAEKVDVASSINRGDLSSKSKTKEQVRTKDEVTGEDVVTVDLDEITVVARSKNVPERFGKVSMDFIITIPKKLIDKRWMITLTPQVEKFGESVRLEDIVINGELYRLYQEKGESVYKTLAARYKEFNRDTTQIKDYFFRKYNLQYNNDARLDTIIPAGKNFHYYYKQEMSCDESKKMNLFLTGSVFALDKSTCALPLSDTIAYYISSMVQFVDEAPRFVQKVIERHAEANFSAHITFPTGKENIDENLNDNATEITKVQDIIKQLTFSSEFIIDSINMTASASPEGSWQANELLAKRRAASLKKYFAKKLDDKEGVDTLFNAKWIAEDWKRVYDLIADKRQEYKIGSRAEILAIIESEPDPDRRERQIKERYPLEYKCIKDSIYPLLRTVEFQFNLHRSGMTKDTIHTTEPDTLYDVGRELLKARRYKEALSVLLEYNDYNTAITYMSLGYDNPAYEILLKQPESANSEYLLAILCSRLGQDEEAVRRFLHACKLDASKVYRGALDPEINRLIKSYKLNKILNEYE